MHGHRATPPLPSLLHGRLDPSLAKESPPRTADCERGSAVEGFQPCPAHPPPVAARGRAPDNDAHDSAAHRARHSYTAAHLARTPRAPPRQGNDAFGLRLGSGSALTGYRGSMDRTSGARVWAGRTPRARLEKAQRAQTARWAQRAQTAQWAHTAQQAQTPRVDSGEASCRSRSALSSARARTLRARA